MSWLRISERILFDFFLHILLFPVWWYTQGAQKILLGCFHLVEHANMQFAPGLWAKNLFVPMFGQRDWQGRLMSFFMRLANIIFRSIVVIVWSVIVFALFLLWLFLPILVLFFLVISGSAYLFS